MTGNKCSHKHTRKPKSTSKPRLNLLDFSEKMYLSRINLPCTCELVCTIKIKYQPWVSICLYVYRHFEGFFVYIACIYTSYRQKKQNSYTLYIYIQTDIFKISYTVYIYNFVYTFRSYVFHIDIQTPTRHLSKNNYSC